MKTATISIKENNVRINGENIGIQESGLDGLFSIEKIKEYLLERDGIEEVEFVDGDDRKVKALLKLKQLAEEGDIYHDVHTGEEWLGIHGRGEILLGRGDATDWGKYNGKNWKPLQGIKLETVSIPDDGQPGLVDRLCFVQKNTEVSNPVNDCAGWMDEFEILDHNGECVVIAKRLY